MSGKRWIWVILLLGGVAVASPVSADDGGDREALTRLKRYGDMSTGTAKRVLGAVEKRMKKSADNFTPATDPLRVAVSRALFNADVPPNAMQGAKVRLRLFAGADGWALEAFFRPSPGQISNCTQVFSLSSDECTALVAAAGRVSLADARNSAGGAGAMASQGGSPFGGAGASPFGGSGAAARPAPAQRAQAVVPPQGNRFARYDSGFRASSAPAPRPQAASGPRPLAQRPGAPQPAVAPVQQASTKEAYKARREAYLARQRERMNQKKAQQAKAASAEPEPAVAPADETPAPDANPLDDAPAPAPAADKPKQQLSDDFLQDLMADPLGQ